MHCWALPIAASFPYQDDDVFQGDPAQGKLGANAYGDRVVTLDYPNARLKISGP